MALNVERVRQLADRIEKAAREDDEADRVVERFDMTSYFDEYDAEITDDLVEKLVERREPICGTSACAAGWAVFMFAHPDVLSSHIREEGNWHVTGMYLLGMTPTQANLFGRTSWDANDVAAALRRMADEAESP